MGRVTSTFDNQMKATKAVDDLRAMGISDAHMSFVSKHDSYGTVGDQAKAVDNTGNNVAAGLGVGAGVGALFGIAAALIPGAGPFIAAGVLAQTLGAVGGGAVAGAVVGATAGGLAGAFSNAGYNQDEANYYGSAVESGSTVVAVDVPDSQEMEVRRILENNGGRAYNASNATMNTGGMSARM
jgi:hypothetical protein